MKRLLVIALAFLTAAGIGIGCWIAFRPGPEAPGTKGHSKLMEELASKRDHLKLVISGRLMAEIYPCG